MKPMPGRSAQTRSRILAAATGLFARKGKDRVIVRELTATAGVNLAAINYHFGSKDALWEAVIERAASLVNSAQLKALHNVLDNAQVTGQPPEVADILVSFIDPCLRESPSSEAIVLAQLVLQDRSGTCDTARCLVDKHLDPLAGEFVRALALACPQLHTAVLAWRFSLVQAVVPLLLLDPTRGAVLGQRADAFTPDEVQRQILATLLAAVGSPSPARALADSDG